MEAKHTSGPWKIGEQYLGCRDIFAPMPGDEPNIEICSTSGLPEEEDDIANARLIAAAPDLLAALRAIVARINGVWDDPDLLAFGELLPDTEADIEAIASQAIAKARGGK